MSFGNEREFIDHLQSKGGKEQAMKCPLLLAGAYGGNPDWEAVSIDCLKEECAWWDVANGHCALIELNRMLYDINATLVALVKKMPHAGQFTK